MNEEEPIQTITGRQLAGYMIASLVEAQCVLTGVIVTPQLLTELTLEEIHIVIEKAKGKTDQKFMHAIETGEAVMKCIDLAAAEKMWRKSK